VRDTTGDDDWRKRARCKGLDPEMFFAGKDERAETEAAKAICAGCPVQGACLEYALANGIEEGVWGGLGERSRRRIRRQRRLARLAS
jgi:WhiB family transcriptional regulator, redox-sensing transcriptional regulator